MERTLHLLLVLWFCFLSKFNHVCMGCRDKERQALLSFRRSLNDNHNVLSNWNGGNCCRWAGVSCGNTAGHVIKLDIGSLGGDYDDCAFASSQLDHSLSTLKHLQHLDLRYSCFNYTTIPHFIGSFTALKYLDLSSTDFAGRIPSHLGNLTSLQYLNLSRSSSLPHLFSDGLHWLSHLSSLQYLDMSLVNLNNAIDWPLVFNKLPALLVLLLAGCDLHTSLDVDAASVTQDHVSSITTLDLSWNSFPDSTKLASLLNLSSNLVHLDLSYCSLCGPIPHSLGKLSSLKKLDLSSNKLNGSVPKSFGQLSQLEILDLSNNSLQGLLPRIHSLCNLRILKLSRNKLAGVLNGMREDQSRCKRESLEELDLSLNRLSGSLPDWIGQSKKLNTIDLSLNILDGFVPQTLGQLSELVVLNLGFNSLQGAVLDALFDNMTKLEELNLSWNLLNFTVSSTWVPPFQLKIINLVSCKMGPQFPSWLRTQRRFSYLDISHAGISDQIPYWFWKVSSRAEYLNISNNLITGEVPASLKFLSAKMIDLSSNQFYGQLPHLNSSARYVFLHDNFLSGNLQPILTEAMGDLNIVSLSRNLLSGKIPLAICNMRSLGIFDISHNNISGEIPKCQINPISSLVVVNLANNYLHGSIPQWMASSQLEVLRLHNNSIHGEIPYFLRYCTGMIILDLAENKLTGNFPSWIGESLSSLKFLRLRSNMLTGTIPPQLSYLTSLQVLDLAQNNLSGTIPSSFKNFTAMAQLNRTVEDVIHNYNQAPFIIITRKCLEQTVDVVVKGRQLEYTKTLSLVMVLDLSCNRLSEEIPMELMGLIGLQSLNLSKNQLMGRIPDNFGGMGQLEALDLSGNHLLGSIPRSITLLSSLSYLNLSCNNLSGRIPSGDQLQTLTDPSIYVGNRDLCGFPLSKCPGDGPSVVPVQAGGAEDNNDDSDLSELYLSMSLGYVVGLWGICGTFLFKASWRTAYFRFFDDMANKFFLAKERLRRRILLCAL